MFFVSQILMFFIIFTIQINSVILEDTNKIKDVFDGKTNSVIFKIKDRTDKDVTSFTTSRLLFKLIQNLTSTKAPNLKSNIFDKMLSDELLSIKKYFHEKDISTTAVTRATTANVATPTLEVKQHWLTKGFTIKRNSPKLKPISQVSTMKTPRQHEEKSNDRSNSETSNDDNNIVVKSKNSNEKVLELRSLPQVTPNTHTFYHNQAAKMCTCIKTNNPNRCTTTIAKTSCSHTSSACTSSMELYSISPIYFATIQPYFIGETTQYPYRHFYYHPKVINELKLPRKTKRRKHSKVYIDKNLYYDSDEDDSVELLNKLKDEDDINLDRGRETRIDLDREREKHKTTTEKEDLISLNIKTRDKLVQDIYNDLKIHYTDSVVKDCYCSSLSSSSSNQVLCFKFLQCFFILIIGLINST